MGHWLAPLAACTCGAHWAAVPPGASALAQASALKSQLQVRMQWLQQRHGTAGPTASHSMQGGALPARCYTPPSPQTILSNRACLYHAGTRRPDMLFVCIFVCDWIFGATPTGVTGLDCCLVCVACVLAPCQPPHFVGPPSQAAVLTRTAAV